MTLAAVPLIVWGILAHRTADWLLQNEWQALKKTRLSHPAAWVHSGIHTLIQVPVFGLWGALLIGCCHILIDTRVPLTWWGRVIKQTETGEVALHVKFNRDQVLHEVVIALVALLMVTP